jgi:hypothetical protein
MVRRFLECRAHHQVGRLSSLEQPLETEPGEGKLLRRGPRRRGWEK